MTEQEKQEIISAVLSAIRTNSKTISQLTSVSEMSDDDNLELNGGRKVSYGVLFANHQSKGEANEALQYIDTKKVDKDSRGLVEVHQAPVVFLDAMGSLDGHTLNGNLGLEYRTTTKLIYDFPGGKFDAPKTGAVYISKNNFKKFVWNGTDLEELKADECPLFVDYSEPVSFATLPVGGSYYVPSSHKIAVKIDASNTKTYDPLPDALYFFRDKGKVYTWNSSTNKWVPLSSDIKVINDLTTGGEGVALSAEMGKELKEMIDSICSIGSSTLGTGTFNEAWARSQIDNSVFSWLLNDEVEDVPIVKPIWHLGNGLFIDAVGAEVLIEAESVPASPTITINGVPATSGATIARNTQVVITPSSGSVLFYRQGSGAYNRSDKAVTLTMSASGTQVISAYCANNKGNSTAVEVTLEVQGTPVPTFTPATSEVSRGGVVTIVGEAGGTLRYKIGDAATYTDVTGVGDAAPQATITIDGQTTDANRQITIHAYNTINGEDSGVVSKTYTMAALAAPTFSVESGTEFPADGGSVALSAAQGATIYYTTDGSTPTTSSTQYTSAVAVNSAMTIKAIAVDAYGSSDVASASYSVKLPKIIVTTNGATTMSLGDTDLTAIQLESGVNEISLEDINTLAGTSYTSFADHVFASLSFGDKSKLVKFDGGGVRINNLSNSFNEAVALTECVGIVLAPIGSTGAKANSAFLMTGTCALAKIVLSGEISGTLDKFAKRNGGPTTVNIEFANLHGNVTVSDSAFWGCKMTSIDLTGLTTIPAGTSMFRGCTKLSTIKVNKMVSSSEPALMFYDVTSVRTIVSMADEPYTAAWLNIIGSGLTAIYVPDDSVDAYKAHASWSDYADKILGLSNYNG